jgi:hypothetical protein
MPVISTQVLRPCGKQLNMGASISILAGIAFVWSAAAKEFSARCLEYRLCIPAGHGGDISAACRHGVCVGKGTSRADPPAETSSLCSWRSCCVACPSSSLSVRKLSPVTSGAVPCHGMERDTMCRFYNREQCTYIKVIYRNCQRFYKKILSKNQESCREPECWPSCRRSRLQTKIFACAREQRTRSPD